MSATASPNGRSGGRPARESHDSDAVPMTVFLWVVVLVALTYGVVQTLTKVVALFS